jgi:protein-S-isoprenylcysteine O-methyltransferase Ste14
MHVRWVGQLLVFFALLLVIYNVLQSMFGRWVVMSWFSGLSPIDVMFMIAVGLVAMMCMGRPPPPIGASGDQRTKTIW